MPATKVVILGALRRTGDPQALATVRTAMKDADAAVQDAAMRTLIDWPNATPSDDLLAIVASDPKQANQVPRSVGLPAWRTSTVPAAQQVAILTKTLAATAKCPEDKKVALAPSAM